MSNAFNIFQDWSANRGNPKGRIVMVLFRTAHLLRLNLVTFVLFLPYFILYRLLVEWFLCIELPWKTRIGAGFRIDHGQALIVNDNAVFGAGCTVRNSTTIGNRRLKDGTYSASPRFGDRVDIGANAVIIGPLVIGDDAAIGAGAVVVKDVPAGHVAVGNPARIIPRRS
ncbi:MAG TPA: DapH/DapD/GlmU-related protein [Flavobacteriales bacterium]|nr:serine acetyltransferase [Flavobacteriales bacterium]MCB0783047.1 serine acetyltransferase [Flavobacteriales bacterium]MCB0787685.1 serine acetyltransferase [Flavobacteriales bacterium]MCB0807703.1 serine acetyltransferase [Flavobacteriales bacterium]MCB0811951.1 serine acetyltransferase [Flavobacteriales bacterium]